MESLFTLMNVYIIGRLHQMASDLLDEAQESNLNISEAYAKEIEEDARQAIEELVLLDQFKTENLDILHGALQSNEVHTHQYIHTHTHTHTQRDAFDDPYIVY
jgi:hypothetical protein